MPKQPYKETRRRKDIRELTKTKTSRIPARVVKTRLRRIGKGIAKLGGYRASTPTVVNGQKSNPYSAIGGAMGLGVFGRSGNTETSSLTQKEALRKRREVAGRRRENRIGGRR